MADASTDAAPVPTPARIALGAIGVCVVAALVAAPLAGWPRVLRLPALLIPALLLAVCVVRPWRMTDLAGRVERWQPSARAVAAAATVVGLLLAWYVVTRFQSAQINAIDFTVYYDRPCSQTVHGRPLFVEASDSPGFSYRSELADHAYWGMLALCLPYAIHPSPYWLHLFSVLSIVGGSVLVLRILQRLGAGSFLAAAAALAFVLNDNVARTINYGFHPEVLYACFIPWMIHAGVRGARRSFLLATLATVLVKEDAVLSVFAVSVALLLGWHRLTTWRDRVLFLVLPTAAALANLAFYYSWVVPLLTGGTAPTYASFWGNYGDTPMRALGGMCRHPRRVARSLAGSGIARTLQPHLFLPLVGWRWALGLLPILVLFGASANDQLRAFGIYYAIVLVPLFVVGGAMGALWICRGLTRREGYAQLAAATLVLLGALLVGAGSRGYSLRPWKPETRAVPEALARLRGEPVVLVQSGLFPHAGYDERFVLLTPGTLRDPRYAGAAVLLSPNVGAYPFAAQELAPLLALPSAGPMPARLIAARLPRPEAATPLPKP